MQAQLLSSMDERPEGRAAGPRKAPPARMNAEADHVPDEIAAMVIKLSTDSFPSHDQLSS
jgi:hypothetical protein